MKLNKKMMILAAAGALGAVSATSALAFENEFHGTYKLKYFITNYETGSFGFLTPNAENRKASNFFDQRARIFYTAKASDDVKLVTGFEIDSIFGDKSQGQATRNQGGALEADAVNLETKWVYLDFKIPSTTTKVTAGIQPVKDVFKGVFLDADLAGVNTVSKFGPATVGVGYFRAYDQSFFSTSLSKGTDDLDIVAVSGDYAINKDLKVGAAYYLYSDNRSNTPTKYHVFGVNADAKIGALALSGFAAAQQGVKDGTNATHQYYNGYAANVAAKLPIGPGNLRSAFLYASGDDGKDGINTSWQSVSQTQPTAAGINDFGKGGSAPANTYNDSNMMLLNRAANMEGTQADVNIVNSINNKDQGVIMATVGYDATITPKFYTNVNVGAAWASKNNATKPTDKTNNQQGGSNYLGTEVNIETGYKLYDNLTASVQGAYVFLGGYFAKTVTGGKDPEDPYTGRVALTYTF